MTESGRHIILGHQHECPKCGGRWIHDYEIHGDVARHCALPLKATCPGRHIRRLGQKKNEHAVALGRFGGRK